MPKIRGTLYCDAQIDNRYSLGVKLYGVYPRHVNGFVRLKYILMPVWLR